MRSTEIDEFVHLVWETEGRRRSLTADLERTVHRAIREAAAELGLRPVAVNSAWDHVHTLIGWNHSVPFIDAVRLFKRRARLRWSAERHARDGTVVELAWEDGYASTGVHPDELLDVTRYIDLQKALHGEDRIWPRFERGVMEIDDRAVRAADAAAKFEPRT